MAPCSKLASLTGAPTGGTGTRRSLDWRLVKTGAGPTMEPFGARTGSNGTWSRAKVQVASGISIEEASGDPA